MNTTKLSVSGNHSRSTLPRALADAISMHDRENRRVAYRVVWTDAGLGIEMSFDPALESWPNVKKAQVLGSGQVRLEFPTFQVAAWGLADHQLAWPAADEVEAAPAEAVTLTATVQDWEPPVEADLFAASAGFTHQSTITKSGDERTNVETHVPIRLAEARGLTDEGVRAAVSFDIVDGRKVMVVDATDADASEMSNSLAVHLAGASDRQARINAARIAAELDVLGTLDEESVHLRWGEQNGQLLAFISE